MMKLLSICGIALAAIPGTIFYAYQDNSNQPPNVKPFFVSSVPSANDVFTLVLSGACPVTTSIPMTGIDTYRGPWWACITDITWDIEHAPQGGHSHESRWWIRDRNSGNAVYIHYRDPGTSQGRIHFTTPIVLENGPNAPWFEFGYVDPNTGFLVSENQVLNQYTVSVGGRYVLHN